MTASTVVVPVHVQALCVNDNGPAGLRGPAHDFTSFPSWDDGAGRLVGEPYLSASVTELPVQTGRPGVHVHWQLPDALRRGTYHRASRTTTFPQAPDRWLVTRVATGAGAPALRIWVLESNRQVTADAGQGSASMPYRDPDGNQYYRFLGRLFDYDAWKDSGCDTPLTAVGYGEVSYASYYPSCRNVFGFFDDLRAGPNAPPPDLGAVHRFSYRVLGWYSRAAADPLTSMVSGAKNHYGWRFTGSGSATVCSGALVGVTWDPAADFEGPSQSDLAVAIGNTNGEALAALVASDPELSADVDAEFLLNAVQAGLLGKLASDPDRSAELAFALHQRSFAHAPGGSVWTLKPATPLPDAAVPAAPPAPVTPAVAHALAELNVAQQAYDDQTLAQPGAALQLFFDWYRLQLLDELDEHPDPNAPARLFAPQLTSALLGTFVSGEAAALAKARRQAGTLDYERHDGGDRPVRVEAPGADPGDAAAGVCAAHAALVALPGLSGFVLRRHPADRYWIPNDPVLLLSGDDVSGSARRVGGRVLPCRLATELNDTLAYVGGPALTTAQLAAGQTYARLPDAVAGVARSLLAETLLADAGAAAAIAAVVVAADSTRSATPVEADLAALRTAMADHGTTSAGTLSTSGIVAASIGRATWAGQPWEPLFLRWNLDYFPAAGAPAHPAPWTYSPSLIADDHVFDRAAVDLEIDPSLPEPAASAPYSGIVPLASNATADLAQAIERALAVDPDPQLADIAKHLPTGAVLAQTLGGLHRALLGEDARIQIEVFDPKSADPHPAARVAAQVGSGNDAAPDALSLYAALRSGFAGLGELTLVDAFGQVRTVAPSRVAWSAQLKTDDPGRRVVLPPRLTQAARLRFAWVDPGSGDVELGPAPQLSPVCGWVVPNFVDQGLTLFAADGTALGGLTLIDGGSRVRWLPAPQAGGQVAPDAPGPDAEGKQIEAAVDDPTLCAFALGVLTGGAAYLQSIVEATDIAAANILPPAAPQASATALLMGRPLALARALAALEVRGSVTADQSWEALQADVLATPDGSPSPRTTHGVEHVAFPVRIGDLAHSGDGLVGYFRTGPGEPGFSTLFSPAVRAGMTGILSSDDDPLPLTIAGGRAELALLFDPAGSIHATTGILPVASLAVPPDQYVDGLGRLATYFYAGPVLTPRTGRPLQLPAISGVSWSWRQAISGQWTEEGWTGAAGDRGAVDYGPVRLDEGWVVLTRVKRDGG